MTGPGLERLLREALEQEAQACEPRGDGLARIRERVQEHRERRRWVLPSAAVAGLGAAAAAVLFSVPVLTGALAPAPERSVPPPGHGAGHGPAVAPSARPTPGHSPTASPGRPGSGFPSGGPSARGSGPPVMPGGAPTPSTGSGTSPGAGGSSRAVAVYYADGDRLVREFHAHPVTSSVIRAAVTAMLADPPQDPDYRGLWPAGTQVLGVSRHPGEGLTTVDLSAAPTGNLALQQLAYTVTAADPATTHVAVEVNGREQGGALTRSADVLAPVWVLAPAEDASVGTTFTASGTASVFEGTVSWQLLDPAGTVVAQGSAQASAGAPARASWSATVAAPGPGRYTFVAYETSARDGSMQWPDSKTVVIH